MTDEQKPQLTEKELEAKARLESSLQDLQKAAAGTTLAMALPLTLINMQLEALVSLLAQAEVIDRIAFWERITAAVDKAATECRRAVLASGGASALAGLKRPS